MTKLEMSRFVEKWAHAVTREGAFGELLAEGVDAAPFEARAAAVRERFGRIEVVVDELVVDGERIAWRWTLRAGASSLQGVNFQRIVAGRAVEHWTLTANQS